MEPDWTVMNNIIRKRWTPNSADIKTWTEEKDNGEEYHYARVPVSSVTEDRDGDNFSEQGLKNMASQYAGKSVNLFPDHGASEDKHARYPWKDIMGRWEDAEIDGSSTLYADVRFNRENDDADLLRRYIDEDMAVGFSVGFKVVEADGDQKDGFEFHEVDLLETSAVGIPSNPDGVASMSAESDEWRGQLDKELNMSDDDNDDLYNLLKELQEDVNEIKAQNDSDSDEDETEDTKSDDEPLTKSDLLDILEARDAKADDNGDDDDDDDEDDEDDNDDDDGKSFSVTVTSESEERIKSLLEAAEDDTLDMDSLEESKTVTVSEIEQEDNDADEPDPMKEWGF